MKEMIRIIFPETRLGCQSHDSGTRHALAIGKRARGVGRTVGSVGRSAKHNYPLPPIQSDRGAKGKLLVSPALASAPNRYPGLAAGDDARRSGDGMARAADFFGEGGVHLGHLPGFPLDEAGKDKTVVSELDGLVSGCLDGLDVAAYDHVLRAGKRRVASLGGLFFCAAGALLQLPPYGGGDPNGYPL